MPEQTTATNVSPPSYRVKVYNLDENTIWVDKGTGICVYLEGHGDDPDEIFVRSEIDSTPLVSSSVFTERTYHKESETVILWTDVEKNDLAISFEDAEGRDDIWQRICNKRGVDQHTDTLQEVLGDEQSDTDTVLQTEQTLPTPTMTNLGKIVKVLENSSLYHNDGLAKFILKDDYVSKLFPIFEACEKSNNIKRIHQLFTIIKSIILLSDKMLIEHIINDENIIPVASILEYDTATPSMKANHREILKAHSQMEPVVALDDVTTLLILRQTYRFQYMKDVIMARYLDESLSSMLQTLIGSNHVEALNHIQYNTKFLEDLFGMIKRHDTDDIERTKAVQAVLQICTISKSLQPPNSRVQLYRILARHGLFIPIEIALSSDDPGMRKAGAGALCSIVDMDVSLLRTHILSQQPKDDADDYADDTDDDDNTGGNKRDLLQCVINRFTSELDSGLKFQYGDILKITLELNTNPPPGALATSKNLRKQIPGIDDLLTVFYDKYAPSVLQPLMDIENKPMKLDGPIEVLELERDQGEVYSHLLDFLCFAVQQHGHRSKYWMLSGDCFVKVAQLYRSRLNWVKIAALRFFRVCVGLLDDFYNRHLIKHNVFESTIRLLLDTDGKGNVLNSNCLELLEFIHLENPKLLVTHLIERFGSVLDTVDYISTCKVLQERYNSNQAHLNTLTSLPLSDHSETGNDDNTSSMDRYEEGYFNESDDEDDQKLDDFGVKIDQFLSSVSPPPPPATIPPVVEVQLDKIPSDDDDDDHDEEMSEDTTTIDNETSKDSGHNEPSYPLRPLKNKRDDDDDDEDDVLAAKVAKHSDKDQPSVSKRNGSLIKKH
ncbi:component of IIS longevity pathway SMK-1-domain-containing protein [Chlamydoabsidia padenii]|nr:component of IIS longevity pathway SMK-1-domain-containing protein [Chlamydoabsidia padenii]